MGIDVVSEPTSDMSGKESDPGVSAQPETSPMRPPPCTLVVFGGAGDLTRRLIAPALYNLKRAHLLPEEFAVVGVAHHDLDDGSFRQALRAGVRDFIGDAVVADDWGWLAERMRYLRGEFEDPQTYTQLAKMIDTADGPGNVLFYLATPAKVFSAIVNRLGQADLVRESPGQWRRVVVEKPFGNDLASSEALNRDILGVLTEPQVFRIDHYLGKETVQNILVLRFANGLFEPLWSCEHIDHVQITASETIGVEGRGKFYEATGALRDMVPNHLFQLLALVAMEPPGGFRADALNAQKAKVLDAVQPFDAASVRANVVRGQYGAGVLDGGALGPYRSEPDVAADSATETYVALKLMIDNWRWMGVPFYLRTGKALAARQTEITVQFKQAPMEFFRGTPVAALPPNDLTLHIQPDEGVTLRFGAKAPGPEVRIGGVEMKFAYEDYFKISLSTGYETLIYDCMIGDATLFQRADTIEAGWRIVQPMLDFWAHDSAGPMPTYPAGGEGPAEATALLQRDGRSWRPIKTGPPLKS
jgi:glucose-6-phosphate 1-dehydrogenase